MRKALKVVLENPYFWLSCPPRDPGTKTVKLRTHPLWYSHRERTHFNPMDAFNIPLNAFAIQTIIGLDASGNRAPLASVSVTVDDYSHAYVADLPEPAASRYAIVPKNVAPGQPVTVNVTIHGTSQDGTQLPPVTQQYTITEPAPPPQAVTLSPNIPSLGSGSAPADPGSPTATLTPF